MLTIDPWKTKNGGQLTRHIIRAWEQRFAEESGANCSTPATGAGRHDDVAVRAAPGVRRGAAAPCRHAPFSRTGCLIYVKVGRLPD
jgi:hypothetical protein